jgi:glycosyltransferase involved in cell wall biosynthesis
MMFLKRRRKAAQPSYLSVVVIFHNMRREAARTLFSLSPRYQRDVDPELYEVIAIDNGSTEPLAEDWVESFGHNFRYEYFKARHPSPAEALNYGVSISSGKFVTLCIDGARILSPNILNYSLRATKLFENPFIYTLAMHIGSKLQNYLVEENYDQEAEDQLISSTDWETDGYSLFEISSVAASSGIGFFSQLKESNCFSLKKSTFQKIGGFEEKFTSPGGGYTNLDFFNRTHQLEDVFPVMLLGEATFHQYHGGVATNVPFTRHPWKQFQEEYERIRKREYETVIREPYYYGRVHAKCANLLAYPNGN